MTSIELRGTCYSRFDDLDDDHFDTSASFGGDAAISGTPKAVPTTHVKKIRSDRWNGARKWITPPRLRNRTALIFLYALAFAAPILLRLLPSFGLYDAPLALVRISGALSPLAAMAVLAFHLLPMLEEDADPPSVDGGDLRRACERIAEISIRHGNGPARRQEIENALLACARLVALSDGSIDHETIDASTRVSRRLPEIVAAYDRVDHLATDEEARGRFSLLADGVVALGLEAETARRRMLARATDELDTRSRHLRSAAEDDAGAFRLAPVADAASTAPTVADDRQAPDAPSHRVLHSSSELPY